MIHFFSTQGQLEQSLLPKWLTHMANPLGTQPGLWGLGPWLLSKQACPWAAQASSQHGGLASQSECPQGQRWSFTAFL